MARPRRHPGRGRPPGHAWRVALVFGLLWLTAGFACQVEESQDDLCYPELYEQAFRIVPGPAFTADPWTEELLAAWGDESEEESESAPDGDNKDADEERREPWRPDLGWVAFVTPAVDLACISPGDPAAGAAVPPPPAQRPLLHLLQTLLI